MRYLFWKKRGLLLLAICVTALFVTITVPKNSHSIPLGDTIEGQSGMPAHLISDVFPAAEYGMRFIGEMVFKTFHSGDQLPNDGGSLKENFGLDFIHSVPEPSTLLLVGSGLIGFALLARKRIRK